MDETQEDRPMPKLRELMADETTYFADDTFVDKTPSGTDDLAALLRSAPRRPQVEIRVSVTLPDGTKDEEVRYEDAELWERGYRQYYKVRQIMDTAERVAAQVAWEDDAARLEREDG